MAALRQAPLRLSSLAGSPHLRMMASGARAFSATPTRPAFVQPSAPVKKAAVVPDANQTYVKGTVNDPTTFPPPSPSHGSYHWLTERGISVALIPLFAAGAAKHGVSGVLDASLALSLVLHSHIGFTASLDDYVHPRKFPVLGPIGAWTLRAATLATLVGLYEFQTNDVGFTEMLARVWTA